MLFGNKKADKPKDKTSNAPITAKVSNITYVVENGVLVAIEKANLQDTVDLYARLSPES